MLDLRGTDKADLPIISVIRRLLTRLSLICGCGGFRRRRAFDVTLSLRLADVAILSATAPSTSAAAWSVAS
jgi:hypothetical protein